MWRFAKLGVAAVAVALCTAGCVHRDAKATCFDYRHRPAGYGWHAFRDPTGASIVYYGRDPKTGRTVYVGPDSQYYTFSHPGGIAPSDLGSGWEPHDAYKVNGKEESCERNRVVPRPVQRVWIGANWVIPIDSLVKSLTGAATNLIVDFMLVAILFAVPLEARLKPRHLRETSSNWPQCHELATALIFAAGLFMLGFHWLILQDGIPILRHDWAWPSDDVQLRTFFASISAPWSLGGIGAPSVYPALYPLAWCMSALGHFLTTKAVLNIVISVSFLASFMGVYTIVRTQEIGRIGRPGALVAASVYAASPYFVNEFVAGHYLALVGYGLLPLLALIALESEKSQSSLAFIVNAVLAGLFVGFSAVQIQYLVFDMVLLALLCLTSPRPIRLGLFATATVATGLLTQSFSISNLLFAEQAGTSLPMRSTFDWFRDMSVAPQLSTLGYGYLNDYARWIISFPLPNAFWYAAAFAGVLCVAFTVFFLRLFRWPLVCLTGVFLASGSIGPGGVIKAWAYQHLPAASLVRELYNFTAISVLGLAVCLGLAADLMTKRAATEPRLVSRVLVGCGLFLIVAASIAPFISGRVSTLIYLWSPSASYKELADRFSGSPSARVAFLPAAQPLHSMRTIDLPDHAFAGADFWQVDFRGHPVIFEYDPSTVAAVALAALGREDYQEAARVYGLVGVKFLIPRHEIKSYYSQFWFPGLFPRSWSKGSALKDAQRARRVLRWIESNNDFDVYENLYYTPILTIAEKVVACDRSSVYEAAFGYMAGCIRTPRFWPVTAVPVPDLDSYDPFIAWVSAQKFFFVNRATAHHWQSIFTMSARPYLMRLILDKKRKLYWSCVGDSAAKILVDGRRQLKLSCAPKRSARDSWHAIVTLAAGRHTLLVRKGPGAMLLNPVLAYPFDAKVAQPIDPANVAVVRSARPPGGEASLSFTRNTPAEFSGDVVCPHGCVIVFSDAFSPRWRMTLDGREEVKSMQVNLTENSFKVSPGRHTFVITYATWKLGQLALLVQTYSWLAGATVVLLACATGWLRKNRARPIVAHL